MQTDQEIISFFFKTCFDYGTIRYGCKMKDHGQ